MSFPLQHKSYSSHRIVLIVIIQEKTLHVLLIGVCKM